MHTFANAAGLAVLAGLVGCTVERASKAPIAGDPIEESGSQPVDDGIDISGNWAGGCDQTSDVDTGGWPLHSDHTFDLVDTFGELTGRAGQAWVHGHRTGLHVNFHLAFSASTTGSTNETYYDLDLDEALTTMTGELASYATGPTYTCTFTR